MCCDPSLLFESAHFQGQSTKQKNKYHRQKLLLLASSDLELAPFIGRRAISDGNWCSCEFADRYINQLIEALFWQKFQSFMGCINARKKKFKNILIT